jgi:hypothetical protein
MATRHSALDQRTLGAAVGEEIARAQRNEFGLILHVLPASGEGEEGEEDSLAG